MTFNLLFTSQGWEEKLLWWSWIQKKKEKKKNSEQRKGVLNPKGGRKEGSPKEDGHISVWMVLAAYFRVTTIRPLLSYFGHFRKLRSISATPLVLCSPIVRVLLARGHWSTTLATLDLFSIFVVIVSPLISPSLCCRVLSVTSSGFGYFVFGFLLFFFFPPVVFFFSLSLSRFSERRGGRASGRSFGFGHFCCSWQFFGFVWSFGPRLWAGVFFCWWWYYSEVSDLVVRRRAAAAADGQGKDDSLCKLFPLRLQRE